MKIIAEKEGIITYNEIVDNGISYYSIKKMLNEGHLVVEDRGLYRLPETYIDEYYVQQHRFPKGIFALQTALWLHGLSLTIPFEPVMSFPYGTNTKLIKEAGIKPVILRNNYDDGIVEVVTPGGQKIKVYSIERTLVECLRSIYRIDIQLIAPAFKEYSKLYKIDHLKLFYYAKIFKVQVKLQSYLEIL